MIDAPAARHSEMEDHRVVTIGVDQAVFGASSEPGDLGSGKPLTEILRKGIAQICATRLNARDPAAIEDAFQSADGGLDFGKLGHRHDMAEGEQAG
jgi:hypothetical protein